MSYGIMPYRVNLSRLSTRFGLTITAKRRKVRNACQYIGRNIDGMASNDDTPKFNDIVTELLDGKATHEKYGYIYWYAIKGFIESIGQFLNNSEWYPAAADVFWNNNSFKLYDIDSPMKIPIPDDSPTVFVLRAENMTDELLKELENELGNGEQYWQVASWIQQAKRYKQDLVLFYH